MAEHLPATVIEHESNVAALPVRQSSGALVRPAASVADIQAAFADYQQLCARLLDDSDHQAIAGKRFRKRSAWRKLAVAFGVSFRIVERDYNRDDSGRIISAEFVVRAEAPNGRYADGWGLCDVFERCCPPECAKSHGKAGHCSSRNGDTCRGWTHFSHAEHDVPATAETRAKNRAAADLFGMGEVSAEEVLDRDEPGSVDPRLEAAERRYQAARAAMAADQRGLLDGQWEQSNPGFSCADLTVENAELWASHAERMAAQAPAPPTAADAAVGLSGQDYALLDRAGCADEGRRHALIWLATDGARTSSKQVTAGERDRVRKLARALAAKRARLEPDGPGGEPILLDAEDAPVLVATLLEAGDA